MLAAFGTLMLGAGFAVFQGVHTITARATDESATTWSRTWCWRSRSCIEGTSLLRAVRQLRSGARRYRITPLRFLRRTPDTTVKAVTLEDSAALIGLVLAALGLGLTELTGSPVPDGIAVHPDRRPAGGGGHHPGPDQRVADRGRGAAARCAGRSGPSSRPAARDPGDRGADHVSGPGQPAGRGPGPLRRDLGGRAVGAADEAERRLRARFPMITHVFLDPDPRGRPD